MVGWTVQDVRDTVSTELAPWRLWEAWHGVKGHLHLKAPFCRPVETGGQCDDCACLWLQPCPGGRQDGRDSRQSEGTRAQEGRPGLGPTGEGERSPSSLAHLLGGCTGGLGKAWPVGAL